VVRNNFPFDQVLERFRQPLINEVGTKDFWPALAESAGWGYGSVGSTGFNRPPVETPWHNGFRHNDFLTEAFCQKFWIPVLRGERSRPADKAMGLPYWIRTITWLPLRWICLAVLIALPLVVGQALWLNFGNKIISLAGEGSDVLYGDCLSRMSASLESCYRVHRVTKQTKEECDDRYNKGKQLCAETRMTAKDFGGTFEENSSVPRPYQNCLRATWGGLLSCYANGSEKGRCRDNYAIGKEVCDRARSTTEGKP
jgi:hypothetical protein